MRENLEVPPFVAPGTFPDVGVYWVPRFRGDDRWSGPQPHLTFLGRKHEHEPISEADDDDARLRERIWHCRDGGGQCVTDPGDRRKGRWSAARGETRLGRL